MAEHVPTSCDQCGQTDDHPKLHYGEETYHHDCLPHRVHLDATSHPVVGPFVQSVIDAAKSGVHGDDLRDHIRAIHEDVPAPAAHAHLEAHEFAAIAAPAAPAAPAVEAPAPAAPAAPVAPSEG